MRDRHCSPIISLGLALFLSLTSTPAVADDPKSDPVDPWAQRKPEPVPSGSPGAPPKSAAPQWKLDQHRTLAIQDGEKLINAGEWEGAAQKFREAIGIRSDPRTLLLLGFTQEKLNNILIAKAIYVRALDEARTAKLKPEEEGAQQALAALSPTIPRIDIHLSPKIDATVYLDAALVTLPDGGLEVDPGSHSVTVVSAGRQTFHMVVVAKVGQVLVVEPVLLKRPPLPQPSPQPPPPQAAPPADPRGGAPTGSIVLAVIGGATMVVGVPILIDGLSAGPTKESPLIPAGAVLMIAGLVVGGGGATWAIVASKQSPPHESEARQRAQRPAHAPLDLWVLPMARGMSAGVGGRF